VLFAISGGDDLTMSEVNEIASIITESIDPSARVIFGTIRDNKLKKGEIKVTVIATGFDGIIQKKPAFSAFTKEDRSVADEKPVKNDKKKEAEEIEEIEEIDDADNDDWSAVPAFLRRGSKK